MAHLNISYKRTYNEMMMKSNASNGSFVHSLRNSIKHFVLNWYTMYIYLIKKKKTHDSP